MDTQSTGELKLAALDSDDLDIISAHAQDAVLTVSDMVFRKSRNAFVAMVNRFDWDHEGESGEHHRRRTALHFDRVRSVRARGISPAERAKVLNLLAIRFTADDEGPAGTIELVFSGDAAMRLDVECIEARLKDMGPVWSTENKPDHDASPTPPVA